MSVKKYEPFLSIREDKYDKLERGFFAMLD